MRLVDTSSLDSRLHVIHDFNLSSLVVSASVARITRCSS